MHSPSRLQRSSGGETQNWDPMIDFLKTKKPLKDQSPADKMQLIKLVAEEMLGAKWEYYKKIKHADQGFNLLAEPSLMEQMKATQSALRFTSKNARKGFWATFKSTAGEVKSKMGPGAPIPNLPEIPEGQEVPSLSPEMDAFLLSWTPMKFLQNSKLIREKGVATQRHSEGLVAKLMFKLIAYYADLDNWDLGKLCFYAAKLNEQSEYQEISAAFDPLKADLAKFAETYEPFKFGKASLSKDSAKDADSYDDAFGEESFEDQIKTLYLYAFIYEGMEQFLFRYFANLVFTTPNRRAIRYLATIFEPAIQKAIENKNLFWGSFETDRSKRAFAAPFEEYKAKRESDPTLYRVEGKKTIYESWVYNLPMLRRSALEYRLDKLPEPTSPWGRFLTTRLLSAVTATPETPAAPAPEALAAPAPEAPASPEPAAPEAAAPAAPAAKAAKPQDKNVMPLLPPPVSVELRYNGMMVLLNQMLRCSDAQRSARKLLLERFKQRVMADRDLAQKRVLELKKNAEKRLREMERKVKKLERMKQDETAAVFAADIARFKTQVEEKGKSILADATDALSAQKRKLKSLFEDVAKEQARKKGISAGMVAHLAHELSSGTFLPAFIPYVAKEIEAEYQKEMEPFYLNLFQVLTPSIQLKTKLIQALEKSGGPEGVKLTLSAEEKMEVQGTVTKLKARIAQAKPDLFSSKLLVLQHMIPLEELVELGLNNESLSILLDLKVASPKNPKPTKLPPQLVKGLMVLNLVINPVPSADLRVEGRGETADPVNRINVPQLAKLHSEYEQKKNPTKK